MRQRSGIVTRRSPRTELIELTVKYESQNVHDKYKNRYYKTIKVCRKFKNEICKECVQKSVY
jgi:hypothetical protein